MFYIKFRSFIPSMLLHAVKLRLTTNRFQNYFCFVICPTVEFIYSNHDHYLINWHTIVCHNNNKNHFALIFKSVYLHHGKKIIQNETPGNTIHAIWKCPNSKPSMLKVLENFNATRVRYQIVFLRRDFTVIPETSDKTNTSSPQYSKPSRSLSYSITILTYFLFRKHF